MGQTLFRSDDTIKWTQGFGNLSLGNLTIPSNQTQSVIDSPVTSATAGTKSISATNTSFAAGQLIIIHQTRGTNVGTYELGIIQSYTAGTITTRYNLQNSYLSDGTSMAQVVVIPQYKDIVINNDYALSAKAWDESAGVGGLMVLAGQSLNGPGTINLAGNNASGATGGVGIGFKGGNGRLSSNTDHAISGEGTGGPQQYQSEAVGNGGGGGLGGQNDKEGGGGGGGNGTAGADGRGLMGGSPGAGGAASGNADLSLATFGGGAGGMIRRDYAAGGGGAGGGFGLFLIRFWGLTSPPIVNLNGGSCNQSGSSDGSGGGAGGSLCIKTQQAALGSNIITAQGGAGYNLYGAGAVGRINIDHSGIVTGLTSPTFNDRTDPTIKYPNRGGFLIGI